jgi:hypothetical protein
MGAVGRVVAAAASGWPGWWPTMQAAIEMVIAGITLILTRRQTRE